MVCMKSIFFSFPADGLWCINTCLWWESDIPNIHFFSPPDLQFSPLFSSFRHTPPVFSPHTPFIFATHPYISVCSLLWTDTSRLAHISTPPGQRGTSPPENTGGCGKNRGGCGRNLKKVAKTVNQVAIKKIMTYCLWNAQLQGRAAACPTSSSY